MLTNRAIYEETEEVKKLLATSKDLAALTAGCLKIQTLILKMLSSLRTNQVLMMKKMGVEPIEPQKRKEASEKEQPVSKK